MDRTGRELSESPVRAARKYRDIEIDQGEGETSVNRTYAEALATLPRAPSADGPPVEPSPRE